MTALEGHPVGTFGREGFPSVVGRKPRQPAQGANTQLCLCHVLRISSRRGAGVQQVGVCLLG